MSHEAEIQEVMRRFRVADQGPAALGPGPEGVPPAVRAAHEAGASKSELARSLNISRQRVDEILSRARHEAAAGVEGITD